MSGYVLHPEADAELNEIWHFVAQDSLDAADRVLGEFRDAPQGLSAFPNKGHRRPDLANRPVRFLNVRSFLIAYAADEQPILVLAILHGRRNPRLLAAKLQSRG